MLGDQSSIVFSMSTHFGVRIQSAFQQHSIFREHALFCDLHNFIDRYLQRLAGIVDGQGQHDGWLATADDP
jgi:hypothetical protein